MVNKAILFTIITLMISIVVLIILIILGSFELSHESIELEECVSLKSDGDIDIVFIGEEKETAQEYADYLLNLKPFSDHKNRFSFYFISGYEPECELYKGIALLCYSRTLVKKASSCPHDYIVVLDGSQDRSIRSSNYMNVMSINTNHPLTVFAHEFGHAFVFLAEEYVPAKIPRGAAGNCALTCNEFDGKGEGCFDGCSENERTRSIDSGVMRTLKTNNYGQFNEFLILEKLQNGNFEGSADGAVRRSPSDGVPFGFSPDECSGKEYYFIEGSYFNGEINILERTLEEGCIGSGSEGAFSFEYILKNNERIFGDEFNPEVIFTESPDEDEDGNLEGEIFNREGNFYLKVPIIQDTVSLEINDIDRGAVGIVNLYDIGARACLV